MEWEWTSSAAGCLSCPLCQRPNCFPSLELLLRALQTLTSGQPACAVCGQRLPDLTAYLHHLAGHVSSCAGPAPPTAPMTTPSDQQHYLHCPRCPKKFKTARGRASHMRCKHGADGIPAATAAGLLTGDAVVTGAESAGVSAQTEAASGAPRGPLGQGSGCTDQADSSRLSSGGAMNDPVALLDYCLSSGGQDSMSMEQSSFQTALPVCEPVSSRCPVSSGQGQLLSLKHPSPFDHVTPSASLSSLSPEQLPPSQSRMSLEEPQHKALSPPGHLFTLQHLPLTSPTDVLPCPSQAPPLQSSSLSPSVAAADLAWPAGGLKRRPDSGRRLRRLLQASHACQDCGRVFRLRPGLEAHRRLAHGDGACEQCGVCQRRFTSGRRLQRHLAASHSSLHTDSASALDGKAKETATFECSTCKKTFTTAQFLKKHAKLHTGETPYVCEVCGRAFALQQSYHKHQQYHTTLRPYTCPQCGRAFRESATLQNHMRIHSGEKPWTCETCGKSFRQRITYVVHRRIHTGALPYTCRLCQAGFRYKVSLRAHKCAPDDAAPNTSNPTPSEDQSRTDDLQSSQQMSPPSSGLPICPTAASDLPPLPSDTLVAPPPSAGAALPPPPSLLLPASCELPPLEARSSEGGSGAGAEVLGTAGQLPYRPKVSRLLLRRLVHKLRSRRERSDGLPTAEEPAQRRSPAAALDGRAAGTLAAPQRSCEPSAAHPSPHQEACQLTSEPADAALFGAPALAPPEHGPLMVPTEDAAPLETPAFPPPGDSRSAGPWAGDPMLGTPVFSQLREAGSAGDSALDLDLEQLFQFPVTERRRPAFSPLHRAIESVARELANIPLCSPPGGGEGDWQAAGDVSREAPSPMEATADVPVAEQTAEGRQDLDLSSRLGPEQGREGDASAGSEPMQPTGEEPTDLDMLLSQLFDP